jgi:hypothetical protein
VFNLLLTVTDAKEIDEMGKEIWAMEDVDGDLWR